MYLNILLQKVGSLLTVIVFYPVSLKWTRQVNTRERCIIKLLAYDDFMIRSLYGQQNPLIVTYSSYCFYVLRPAGHVCGVAYVRLPQYTRVYYMSCTHMCGVHPRPIPFQDNSVNTGQRKTKQTITPRNKVMFDIRFTDITITGT